MLQAAVCMVSSRFIFPIAWPGLFDGVDQVVKKIPSASWPDKFVLDLDQNFFGFHLVDKLPV